jgi:nitrite reductase/ring-hydroxylating ferredoxin subunit
MAIVETAQRKRAASLEELEAKGRMVVGIDGNTVCLLLEGDEVHAVDNRCPHMGFPLHRGTVADGILTCHWHHARFDLCSGGTFDQWADELRRFPVEVEDGEIYVDVTPRRDPVEHQRKRLHVGLERDLALVVAKAAIVLAEADPSGPTRSRGARLRCRAAAAAGSAA